MIATCGHEIKQGIMLTLDLGQELSYGSYCCNCAINIHAHDKNIVDGEMKEFLDEREVLSSNNRVARIVINKNGIILKHLRKIGELEKELHQQKFNNENKNKISAMEELLEDIFNNTIIGDGNEYPEYNKRFKKVIK